MRLPVLTVRICRSFVLLEVPTRTIMEPTGSFTTPLACLISAKSSGASRRLLATSMTGNTDVTPTTENTPAPDATNEEFVQVPITEEVIGIVAQEHDDEEEIHVGEGARLLVEEVHFADSDSQDEEVELARETVKKWRSRRRRASAYEVSDEEEQAGDEEGVGEENDEADGGSDGDSVYHSSDSDWSVRTGESESNSDNDSAERIPLQWPQYDPSKPLLEFSLRLGFTGPKEFKNALTRYSVKNQVDYKLQRNNKRQVSAQCIWSLLEVRSFGQMLIWKNLSPLKLEAYLVEKRKKEDWKRERRGGK